MYGAGSTVADSSTKSVTDLTCNQVSHTTSSEASKVTTRSADTTNHNATFLLPASLPSSEFETTPISTQTSYSLIQLMTRRELEEYASSYTRRAEYLERKVEALNDERRQWEAERAIRSRHMLQSGAAQEVLMRETITSMQQEVAAERAMRIEVEESLVRMRSLCRLATERLKHGVDHREALMKEIATLRRDMEQLRIAVDETKLLNAHLQERCEGLEYELDRNQFRRRARTGEKDFSASNGFGGVRGVSSIFGTHSNPSISSPVLAKDLDYSVGCNPARSGSELTPVDSVTALP